MKEFRFELHVTVYAETEDEARRAFCEDPAAWEIDEDDLTCRYIQRKLLGVTEVGNVITVDFRRSA